MSASRLEPVGSQGWADFETAIAVNSAGPKFCAVALDSGGKELLAAPAWSTFSQRSRVGGAVPF